MGRKGHKKAFIDKKAATTYQLIYRSGGPGEDGDAAPTRAWIPVQGTPNPEYDLSDPHPLRRGASGDEASGTGGTRWPPGHPLAWMNEPTEALEPERRRELIELGFPDDGYDYLKHLVTLEPGTGRAELDLGEAPPKTALAQLKEEDADLQALLRGEGVSKEKDVPGGSGAPEFIPPEEDIKTLDASRLTVHQEAGDDDSAMEGAGGVTAFTREMRHDVGGVAKKEMEELLAVMREFDENDFEVSEDWDAAAGEGDLENDFILNAAQPAPAEAGAAPADEQCAAAPHDGEDGESYEEWSSEGDDAGVSQGGESGLQAMMQRTGGRVGSIASTYWREERHDRNDALSRIDERFERLALEYDDDEVGSLEDHGAAHEGGGQDASDFNDVFDEFLKEHNSAGRARVYVSEVMAPVEDGDETVVRRKARELAEAQAERDAQRGDRDAAPMPFAPRPKDREDCESVLSMCSNIYNHPKLLAEPPGRKGKKKKDTGAVVTAPIELSHKTGLPLGVLRPVAEHGRDEEAGTLQEEEAVPAAPARAKGESKEEKKARKAAVKAAQREARVAKKEIKTIFRQENARHQRQQAGAAHGGRTIVALP